MTAAKNIIPLINRFCSLFDGDQNFDFSEFASVFIKVVIYKKIFVYKSMPVVPKKSCTVWCSRPNNCMPNRQQIKLKKTYNQKFLTNFADQKSKLIEILSKTFMFLFALWAIS